jgi:hypothetical protein
VEGGQQLYFDVSIADLIHIRRNAPETLLLFPYAQNAMQLSIEIEVHEKVEEDEG